MGTRIVLQTLIVVAMVLTAGCGSTPTDVGESDSLDPTTDLPDDVEPNEDTGGDAVPDGDGPDAAPVEDDAAFSDPERALREAGSFTSSWVFQVTDGETVSTTEIAQVVDLDAEHSLVSTVNSDGTGDFVMDYYYVEGMEYMRMQSGGPDSVPTYLARQATFEGDDMVYEHGYAYHESGHAAWTETGTTTYDGVTVREYVYDGTEFWLGGTGDTADGDFDVRDVEFRILVDPDGIARYQSFRIDGVDEDGTPQTVEWEYTLTDIGTTVVEDPDWFADAVEQTDSN